MPVYKCTGCGKEQLRSAKELQGHAAQAIAALNDAAGFPHSASRLKTSLLLSRTAR